MRNPVQTSRIFDGEKLRATHYGQGSPRLFVSFDHREKAKREFGVTKPINQVISNGFDHLHLQTARNDWYLNSDLPALREELQAFTANYRRVVAIGNSLSAYGVLLLSRALNVQRAILNSPQSTPFPGRPPFDNRYRMHEKRCLAEFDLTGADVWPAMKAFLLVDPRGPTADMEHARLIAAMSTQVHIVSVPFGGHPCGSTIREAGLWRELLDALMGRHLQAADLARLRRRARADSPSWKENFAAACAARASRNA